MVGNVGTRYPSTPSYNWHFMKYSVKPAMLFDISLESGYIISFTIKFNDKFINQLTRESKL